MHLVQNYTKKDIPNSKRIICYKSFQLNLQLIKYSWWWCYSSMADFSFGFNTTLNLLLLYIDIRKNSLKASIWDRFGWRVRWQNAVGAFSCIIPVQSASMLNLLWQNTHIVSFLPKSGVFFFKCPQTVVLRKEDSNCESVHILKLGIWLSARFTSCCL